MPTMTERQVAHIWRRLGFGPTPDDIAAGVTAGPAAVIDDLLARPLTTPAQWGFTAGTDWQAQELWLGQWLANLARPANPHQERLAWILQGLVVAGMDGTAYFQDVRDHVYRIRQDPRVPYDQLLADLAVRPGLCKYLTNHLNTKSHPNQNLARELLELFTLGLTHPVSGAPNYTEKDVQEVARALTGYQLDWNAGTISFNPSHWDNGNKTFLGASRGAAALTETLTAITGHASWPYFVPRRLYRELMGREPTTAQLDALGTTWGNHGDVGAVVSAIAQDPLFLDASTMATKVRTPVELVAAAARILRVDLASVSLGWELRDLMGQHPLVPPNVSGWPAGTRWLSTSVVLTWSAVVQALVTRSYSIPDGPIQQLHAAGASAAATEAIRLTCLTEATAGTQQALAAYAGGAAWTVDRAAGCVAVALLSPEFFVS